MSSGIDKTYDIIHSTEGTEWHKFATPVPSIGEEIFAMYRAPIIESPLYFSTGGNPLDSSGPAFQQVESHKILIADCRGIRPDLAPHNQLIPLHVPKTSYRPITNGEVIDMMNAALAEVLADGSAKVSSIGTLEAGRKFFISVSISAELRVKTRFGTETIRANLNFVTSHDGTLALNVFDSMIRIVCMNTLRWSMQAMGELQGKVYHSDGASARISQLGEMIQAVLAGRSQFVQAMETLASISADTAAMRHIPKGYFLSIGDGEKLATRSLNACEEISRLAFRGMGNHGETLYDLANGATEYWTSGEGTGKGKTANLASRAYKANFASAAEHKTRFVAGLLNEGTRNEWRKMGASLESKVFSFAG